MYKSEAVPIRKICILLIALMIISVVIGFVFQQICHLSVYNEYCLDSSIHAATFRPNRKVVEHRSNLLTQKAVGGDVVEYYAELPDKKPFQDTSVCLVVYNCRTELLCEDQLIYDYGSEIWEKGGNLGNTLIMAHLPDDVFGKTMTIRCTVPQGASMSKVENVRLMPTEYSLRYVLINHEVDYVFCTSIVSVSVMALLLILLLGRFDKLYRQGIYLFLFFILTGIWQLGSNDVLYFMLNNQYLCSNLEYFAMFLMPIPFCAFLSLEFTGRSRYIFIVMSILFSMVCAAVYVLNFATSCHFFHFTHYQRILMVGGLIAAVLVLLFNRNRNSISERIIRIGSICSITIMSLEVIRYELADTSYLFRRLFSTSFSVFGIMIFVFSLLFGYYSKLSEEILRKRNLEMVVYTDGMTGIPNRTAVIEFLHGLRAEDDYGVVFFDVNDLKKANDVYGHETGDRLITEVAEVLRASFLEHEGFCGRYGGDEFVAGFRCHAASAVEESLKRFAQGVSRLNEQKVLPFEVRVAFGSFVNNPSEPVESEDGIKKPMTICTG